MMKTAGGVNVTVVSVPLSDESVVYDVVLRQDEDMVVELTTRDKESAQRLASAICAASLNAPGGYRVE